MAAQWAGGAHHILQAQRQQMLLRLWARVFSFCSAYAAMVDVCVAEVFVCVGKHVLVPATELGQVRDFLSLSSPYAD